MSLSIQLYQASDLLAIGLSSACANAFAAPLNCSDLITASASSYTWAGLTAGNITNLCTQSCSKSIDSYRQNLVSACANQVYTDPVINGTNATQQIYGTDNTWDIFNINDITVKPVAFVDYWILNYKLNCMNDSSKPPVNCYLKSHNSTDTTGAGQPLDQCDACSLGATYLELQDPNGYDPDDVASFTSLTSSCRVTTFSALTSPTPVYLPNNSTNVYNGTAPTCAGTMVPINGASCDKFAAQNNVSTAMMLDLNDLSAGCADWPGNLTSICVQNTCNTYQVGQNDTCPSIAATHGISITQLRSWNPVLDPLCLNLNQQIGHMVCVSSPLGYTAPSSTVSGIPTTGPTAVAPLPSNADPQSNKDCGRWYLVNPGDNCALVCNKQSITLPDFYFLNPDVNSNCTNLLGNVSYCVAPVGDISTYPGYGGSAQTTSFNLGPGTAATALPTATLPVYNIPNNTAPLYPLASGSISDCFTMFNNDWGPIKCEDAADNFGVSIESFLLWNPSLGNYSNPPDPCTLQNQTQYCGSFYNQSLVPASDSSPYLPVPDPAGPNSTAQCVDWWFVETNDTCQSICNTTDIAFADFYSWNPEIGADCTNLWLNTWYCVAGPGWENSSYTNSSNPAPSKTPSNPTTTPGQSPTGAPGPTQSGIAANCTKYYLTKTGDSCAGITSEYEITFATFLQMNPAVGSDCTNLWIGEAYCVDAPGIAHTSPGPTSKQPSPTGQQPPGPTQSGIAPNCNAYADAQSGDGCYAFATRNKITLDQLYAWNAVLDNNCSNFWAGNAYCIGVK